VQDAKKLDYAPTNQGNRAYPIPRRLADTSQQPQGRSWDTHRRKTGSCGRCRAQSSGRAEAEPATAWPARTRCKAAPTSGPAAGRDHRNVQWTAHASSQFRRRSAPWSTAPLARGADTWPCLHEGVERFSSHLRAHLQKVLSHGAGNLEQQINVAAGLNQGGPIPALDQSRFCLGEPVFVHVAALVCLESRAICRLRQGHRQLVDTVALLRTRAGEYGRSRNRCATIRRSQNDFSMLSSSESCPHRKFGFRLAEDFRKIQHRSGYGRIHEWASVPQSSPQAAHSTTAPANRKVLSCVQQWSGYWSNFHLRSLRRSRQMRRSRTMS